MIAQGREAGGHRGMFLTTDVASQMDTVSLVTELNRQLHVPVVAAGGIASHQDVMRMIPFANYLLRSKLIAH